LRDFQRLTGNAFVTNIWIERKFVEAGSAVPKSFKLTAGSGKHHEVFFCDRCGAYLWSKYYVSPGDTLLVRVGTLDHPEAIQPDVHIFTRSKLPWLNLPKDVPAFDAFYDIRAVWSVQSKSGSAVMLPSKPDPSASRSVSGA
jgi:hypothetical protein